MEVKLDDPPALVNFFKFFKTNFLFCAGMILASSIVLVAAGLTIHAVVLESKSSEGQKS
jgi:hypothetical protein